MRRPVRTASGEPQATGWAARAPRGKAGRSRLQRRLEARRKGSTAATTPPLPRSTGPSTAATLPFARGAAAAGAHAPPSLAPPTTAQPKPRVAAPLTSGPWRTRARHGGRRARPATRAPGGGGSTARGSRQVWMPYRRPGRESGSTKALALRAVDDRHPTGLPRATRAGPTTALGVKPCALAAFNRAVLRGGAWRRPIDLVPAARGARRSIRPRDAKSALTSTARAAWTCFTRRGAAARAILMSDLVRPNQRERRGFLCKQDPGIKWI